MGERVAWKISADLDDREAVRQTRLLGFECMTPSAQCLSLAPRPSVPRWIRGSGIDIILIEVDTNGIC